MPPDDNAADRGRRGTSLVPDRTTRNGPVPVALGLTGAAMMAIALAALLLAGCAAGPDRPGTMHAAWNSPEGFPVGASEWVSRRSSTGAGRERETSRVTTSTPRPGMAPVLTATTVADAPPGTAGVHVTTILNIALIQLEHPGAAPAAPSVPAAGVRAAYGPLIVDGVVLPGLRFGS